MNSTICSSRHESFETDHDPSWEDELDRSPTDNGSSTIGGDSLDGSYELGSSYDSPRGGLLVSELTNKISIQQRVGLLDRRAAYDELGLVNANFAMLLLGEDMSGRGEGVCSAVAISNAITNLYATVFKSFFDKLKPLPPEKSSQWQRGMNCFLSVCDYIAEFFPSNQTSSDGTTLEVMATRPRSDISINLPALQKLDAMLLEMLDSFHKTGICYVNDRKQSTSVTSKDRQDFCPEEKISALCAPNYDIREEVLGELQQKRECVNQIRKAAMVINTATLAEMEIPESYIESLPKSGRSSVGDSIYRYLSTPTQFSPDHLLDFLDISSEQEVLEIANQVETAMHVWHHKATMKSPWNVIKDLMDDDDKNATLASRSKSLLLCLRQRFPWLSQTALDIIKIQHNKDVGQAVIESYSRVLKRLACSIVACIDDVLSAIGSYNKT